MVSSSNLTSSKPYLSIASTDKTPPPPALVIIARLRPVGSGHLENAKPTSNNSSIVVTLNTPDCLNAVSNATSLPANAPVCEDAASAPAELEPDFKIITGFL